jgi:hypothetical protein
METRQVPPAFAHLPSQAKNKVHQHVKAVKVLKGILQQGP